MLKTRIVTAIFLLAGLLGALFFLPYVAWVVLCSLICALAAWEWGGLSGWGRKVKIAYALALGAANFILDSGIGPTNIPFFVTIGLISLANGFWLLVVPFWLKYKWPLRHWSTALVGVIVLLPPVWVLTLLHGHPKLILAIIAPIWVADISAYFFGRALGRAKLAPTISPGKTWAGAFGAAFGVTVYCFAVFFFTRDSFFWVSAGYSIPVILAVSIGLTAFSIMGDLFESLLKRQAGVKDSGHLLPGHGGILDRIDSLTSTLPLWPLLIYILPILRLLSERLL